MLWNGLLCADVSLENYSLTHSLSLVFHCYLLIATKLAENAKQQLSSWEKVQVLCPTIKYTIIPPHSWGKVYVLYLNILIPLILADYCVHDEYGGFCVHSMSGNGRWDCAVIQRENLPRCEYWMSSMHRNIAVWKRIYVVAFWLVIRKVMFLLPMDEY